MTLIDRPRVRAGLVATLCLVPALAVSADGRDRRNCDRGGGKVIAADRGARIYAVGDPSRSREWFGCLVKRGRRVALDAEQLPETSLQSPRIAGRYAAYAISYAGAAGGANDAVLVDLSNGRFQKVSTEGPVSDLVVTRRGVAVLVAGNLGPRSVLRLDLAGEATLDSGAVALGSLAVSQNGRTGYWTKDGVAVASPLR